jgi:hypothetical protein
MSCTMCSVKWDAGMPTEWTLFLNTIQSDKLKREQERVLCLMYKPVVLAFFVSTYTINFWHSLARK